MYFRISVVIATLSFSLFQNTEASLAAERKVRFEIPLSTPYNSEILASTGAKYLYPQQACVDETNGHLFVVNASRGGGDRSQWVAVYEWMSGKFLTIFKAGDGLGETCVVSDTNDMRPSVWIKSRGNNLLEFDVSALPLPMSAPPYVRKQRAAVLYQSAMRDGRWFLETKTSGRDVLSIRNLRFDEMESITLADPELDKSAPVKRQGFAVSGRGIVGSYGSNYIRNRDQGPTEYGIKLFRFDGSIAYDGLDDPETVMTQLNSQGVMTTRLENEGVFVTRDNKIYTIAVTQAANSAASKAGGLAIVQELVDPKDR